MDRRDSGSALERRGVCLVVAAPSGAGKSSVLRALTARLSGLTPSVSATTRQPRAGEQDGVDYFFMSQPAFDDLVRTDALLEHATVFGRSYGTPRAAVEAVLADGRDVALDIDWQGWRQLRAALPDDSVGVFLLPPSLEALDARLRGRKSDEAAEVERRMVAARQEISHWREFDYVIVNDDLGRCVAEVEAVLSAARCTTRRSLGAGAAGWGDGGRASLSVRLTGFSRQLVGCAQQERLVLGIAGKIEPEHGELVSGGAGRGPTLDKMVYRSIQDGSDAGDVTAQLAGPIGLPLGDGTSADIARFGKFILGEAPSAPKGTDPAAYRSLIVHCGIMPPSD